MLDGADCNRQFSKVHFKNKEPASIRRNKLAEDMLDAKMLFLMQVTNFVVMHV